MAKQAIFVMKDGRMDFTATAVVAVGDVVPFGVSLIGVALTDIAVGATGTVLVEGCFNIVAKTAEAFVVGDLLYWDIAAKALTKTVGANLRAGVAMSIKATAETVALIRLNY